MWLFYFPAGFSFWNAMTMSGGGMVFYGGLIFGIACVMIYGLVLQFPLLQLLGVLSAPVALGLAIGRVGCFMAGCCWGDLCVNPAQIHLHDPRVQSQIQTLPILSGAGFPLAVTFPIRTGAYEQHQQLGLINQHANRSLPVHPVQLYEAILAFLLAFALYRQFASKARAGEICVKLIMGYAMIRFVTEFFRADNRSEYFRMTVSQVISVVLAALCLLLVRASARPVIAMAKRPHVPSA